MLRVDQHGVGAVGCECQATVRGARQGHVSRVQGPEHECLGEGPRGGQEVTARERTTGAGFEKIRREGEGRGVRLCLVR
eukprot:2452482-Pleurochrysis_carterae.AAC.1